MKTNYSIKHWAEDDRPREKLILKGRQNLSDSEILAIILGSGTRKKSALELAQEIMAKAGNDLYKLGQYSVNDLLSFHGVGTAKAVSIIAALELGRRRKESLQKERLRVTSSEVAFEILRPLLSDIRHEEFYILLLDKSNHVLKVEQISKGGVDATIADGKIIFHLALSNLASGIILAHNHPSGNLKASMEDQKLTKKLAEFGQMVGIHVLDHLIITDYGYFSFSNQNLL
jgi:DNA repair protein RadC